MEKQLHPKVEKILNVSKALKGKTLTGQDPNEIQVYGSNPSVNKKVRLVNPHNDNEFEKRI